MDARFDIDDDGADRGFRADLGQVLTLRLRPPVDVSVGSVEFQVFNPTRFDPSQTIEVNPPRASKGAPVLTLVAGASSGQSVSPASPNGAVTLTMPAEASAMGHAWLLRCIVNGGNRTLPNGATVKDPALIHERGIFIPTLGGLRRIICTERLQFGVDGWAGEVADSLGDSVGHFAEIIGEPSESTAFFVHTDSSAGVDLRAMHADAWVRVAVEPPLGGKSSLEVAVTDLLLFCGAGSGSGLILSAYHDPNDAGPPAIGFFGADPVTPPVITGATTQQQVDSLVAALVALGLVTDGR